MWVVVDIRKVVKIRKRALYNSYGSNSQLYSNNIAISPHEVCTLG